MIMIRFIQASKIYPKQPDYAIKDINITVNQGDIFGIIGQSGAGKSTIMRLLTGLETLSSGIIELFGKKITHLDTAALRELRRSFGMIFQHFNLLESRTAKENVAYPLEIAGCSKEKIAKKTEELLTLVGLAAKQNTYPSRLSGGEKQRVAIARALALEPKLLLCDEATSALDPQSTQNILELLKELNQKMGLTILLITHEMDVVKTLCNKVAVLNKGYVVEQGSVLDLFSHPNHPITKKFLECSTHRLPTNFLDPSKKIFKLFFHGESAAKPIISTLLKQFRVDINILLGGLDCIENSITGNLVVEFLGQEEEIHKALNYLKENLVTAQKFEDL